MFSRKPTKILAAGTAAAVVAAGTAAAVVAVGAYAIVNSTSHGAAASANAAPFRQNGPRGQLGQGQQPGQANQRSVGQVPQGWHSGSGTIVTGAAADRAKAVAVARYPGGTVNRVLKLSDGSYAVHIIKISWPHHVFVSTGFEVTGAIG